MNNKYLRIIIIVITLICILATIGTVVLNYMLPLYLSHKINIDLREADAVGIIGGADGPTSIYISSSSSPAFPIIFAVLSIIGTCFLIVTRKNKH